MPKAIKILIMAQSYAPEEVSGGVLVTELATDLACAGHAVTVVTATPNYPTGKVFPGYKNTWLSQEHRQGVRIIRTWSYISTQKTFWRRILNYLTYCATSLYGSLLSGRPDVLLCFLPPLPLGVIADVLSRCWGVPWVLQIEDLYPDAAIEAGILTNPSVINFFIGMEKWLYRRATKLSVISDTFRQRLIAKGAPDRKIVVIPVWADPQFVLPQPRENFFRAQLDLSGKFVVMYAGNHGTTSSLEGVLAAARSLKGDPEIRFIFIGEGVQKQKLASMAQQMDLDNVRFLPYQPRELFSSMMAAADIHVVTLNQQSCTSSLPSKTFNIMASRRAALAIAPKNSELCRLVEGLECGMAVGIEDTDQLVRAIKRLKADNVFRERLGDNGRMAVEHTYSRSRCVGMIEEILLQAV